LGCSGGSLKYVTTGIDVILSFGVCSVFLGLLFWVGNYLAPTWIFKDTVFGNSRRNKDDDGVENVPRKLMEEEVDPADLIDLPTNLEPFRGIVVQGFKAGRQKAREEAEAKRRKKSEKGKSAKSSRRGRDQAEKEV